MKVVGVLSGTSVDAIDVCVAEITETKTNNSGSSTLYNDYAYHVELLCFESVAFDPEVRKMLFKLMISENCSARDFCRANFIVGESFGNAIRSVLDKHGFKREDISIIGSHGQTIWHEVEPVTAAAVDGDNATITTTTTTPKTRVHSTLQIGESAVIAEITGIPVISDFRVNDVAAGGTGAPLTSIFDFLVLRPQVTVQRQQQQQRPSSSSSSPAEAALLQHRWRCVQNIGGIGNCTFVPPIIIINNNNNNTSNSNSNSNDDDDDNGNGNHNGTGGEEVHTRVLSFDTGPGNSLIDDAVKIATNGEQQYDHDGEFARRGRVDEQLVSEILSMDYFKQKPPKTTGRELFGEKAARKWFEAGKSRGLSDEDIISSLCEVTCRSIVDAYANFFPLCGEDASLGEVIVGGGGRHNKELMRRLEAMVKERFGEHVRVCGHEDIGINSDAKEALLFALLAYLHEKGRVANLCSVTGARGPRVLGKKTPAPPQIH